jgi:hypothetical protein
LGEDEYMFSGAPPQRTFVGAVGTSVQCHLRTPTPHWLLRNLNSPEAIGNLSGIVAASVRHRLKARN